LKNRVQDVQAKNPGSGVYVAIGCAPWYIVSGGVGAGLYLSRYACLGLVGPGVVYLRISGITGGTERCSRRLSSGNGPAPTEPLTGAREGC
jgi:hypothetical protein